MKMELLRVRFDEQVRNEKRKSAGTAVQSLAARQLKAWRDVVTPIGMWPEAVTSRPSSPRTSGGFTWARA